MSSCFHVCYDCMLFLCIESIPCCTICVLKKENLYIDILYHISSSLTFLLVPSSLLQPRAKPRTAYSRLRLFYLYGRQTRSLFLRRKKTQAQDQNKNVNSSSGHVSGAVHFSSPFIRPALNSFLSAYAERTKNVRT